MAKADPDVFQYLDYRAYLSDLYRARKRSLRGFSYRWFSRRAQLRSPNYLKLVMDGRRNLSAEMAARFARAIELSSVEADYFCELVRFTQASNLAERGECHRRLTRFRRYRNTHRLDVAHAAYYSTWYVPAIRELASRGDFRDDPAWIARTLVPPIAERDAERALEILIELGLLVRDDAGRLCQATSLVSTGPETRALHIAAYHRAMAERAMAAIDLVPPEQRDISSLTLCVGADGVAALKERIQRFRRELLELSTVEPDPEQVVQINFQLFPLSARRERGDA